MVLWFSKYPARTPRLAPLGLIKDMCGLRHGVISGYKVTNPPATEPKDPHATTFAWVLGLRLVQVLKLIRSYNYRYIRMMVTKLHEAKYQQTKAK